MPKKSDSEIARTKIDTKVQLALWGLTAGRCEICNKRLDIDSYFGDQANFAENAHIHAVGNTGPRHVSGMTKDEINKIENLMLLCAEHHHLIDTKPENYPDGDLIARKKRHEDRIRRLTDIQDDAACQIVTFFTNIDHIELFANEVLFKRAVAKANMYPSQDSAILLHEGAQTRYESTAENMENKASDLTNRFLLLRRTILAPKEKVALFALAPQPLLFHLGYLLSDQMNVSVFQCHREGEKWSWPDDPIPVEYMIKQTKDSPCDKVAIVLDLSAEIVDSRVTTVLGDECSIYHLTLSEPNRVFVKSQSIQDEFVRAFRELIELVKNEHPDAQRIHVFPAMPASLAVRAGMDLMPKTDPPLLVYDQLAQDEGFTATITIGGK